LEFLKEQLCGQPGIVWVYGPCGIGKSSLARYFAEVNRAAFPGGAYWLHATALEPLGRTEEREVPRGAQPYLLVLDDLDARPQGQLQGETLELKESRRNDSIIMISRALPVWVPGDVPQLSLLGFSEAEVQALLHRRLGAALSRESCQLLGDFLGGHPLGLTLLGDLMRAEGLNPREVLERLQSFSAPGLVSDSGKQLGEDTREHKRVVSDVVDVSEEFLRRVHREPGIVYDLSSRGFEKLVAELLQRLGYSVQLTPASRDGGKDIYAARKDHLGTFLYIVECKRYAPDRRVGVALVRQLHGVVQAEQATAGILATTSFFTRDAQSFQETIASQVSLRDYYEIRKWLDTVMGG